jgi:hypothetical protein
VHARQQRLEEFREQYPNGLFDLENYPKTDTTNDCANANTIYNLVDIAAQIISKLSILVYLLQLKHLTRLLAEDKPLPKLDASFYYRLFQYVSSYTDLTILHDTELLETAQSFDEIKIGLDVDLIKCSRYKLTLAIQMKCQQMETNAKNQLSVNFYKKCIKYWRGLHKGNKEKIKEIYQPEYNGDDEWLKKFFNLKRGSNEFNADPRNQQSIRDFNERVAEIHERNVEYYRKLNPKSNKIPEPIFSYDYQQNEQYKMLSHVLIETEGERERLNEERQNNEEVEEDDDDEDNDEKTPVELVVNQCEYKVKKKKNKFGHIFSPFPNSGSFGIQNVYLANCQLEELLSVAGLVQSIHDTSLYSIDALRRARLDAYFNTDMKKLICKQTSKLEASQNSQTLRDNCKDERFLRTAAKATNGPTITEVDFKDQPDTPEGWKLMFEQYFELVKQLDFVFAGISTDGRSSSVIFEAKGQFRLKTKQNPTAADTLARDNVIQKINKINELFNNRDPQFDDVKRPSVTRHREFSKKIYSPEKCIVGIDPGHRALMTAFFKFIRTSDMSREEYPNPHLYQTLAKKDRCKERDPGYIKKRVRYIEAYLLQSNAAFYQKLKPIIERIKLDRPPMPQTPGDRRGRRKRRKKFKTKQARRENYLQQSFYKRAGPFTTTTEWQDRRREIKQSVDQLAKDYQSLLRELSILGIKESDYYRVDNRPILSHRVVLSVGAREQRHAMHLYDSQREYKKDKEKFAGLHIDEFERDSCRFTYKTADCVKLDEYIKHVLKNITNLIKFNVENSSRKWRFKRHCGKQSFYSKLANNFENCQVYFLK